MVFQSSLLSLARCSWVLACLLSAALYKEHFFDRVTVTFICLVSIFKLREEFDHGLDVFLDEHQSVHDVAALLKEFLRDMPDSLIPSELYTAFLSTACKHPGCIALFLHSPPITSGFVRKREFSPCAVTRPQHSVQHAMQYLSPLVSTLKGVIANVLFRFTYPPQLG